MECKGGAFAIGFVAASAMSTRDRFHGSWSILQDSGNLPLEDHDNHSSLKQSQGHPLCDPKALQCGMVLRFKRWGRQTDLCALFYASHS